MRPARKPVGTPDAISAAGARANLAMLLTSATPERFAGFTPDSLAATHRVRVAVCATMLERERERRARHG